ncbi:unnamed protein product [Sphagnum balticum]
MHMVTKIQQLQTTGEEGVEVLVNEHFENEEWKGQFTSQIYHLQRFKLVIETINVSDNGCSFNVHNLDAETFALRKVETLDIASNSKHYWSYVVGGSEIDLTNFSSVKTGCGPLTQGWQDMCDPVMTAYKLVTVDSPYWGFGYRMEQAALVVERALFTESHRQCFYWIDEWCDLIVEDVMQLELATDVKLNQRFGKRTSPSENSSNSNGMVAETSNQQAMNKGNLCSSVIIRS